MNIIAYKEYVLGEAPEGVEVIFQAAKEGPKPDQKWMDVKWHDVGVNKIDGRRLRHYRYLRFVTEAGPSEKILDLKMEKPMAKKDKESTGKPPEKPVIDDALQKAVDDLDVKEIRVGSTDINDLNVRVHTHGVRLDFLVKEIEELKHRIEALETE